MSLQPNSQYTDLWSASKLPNCLKCSFPLWIILPQVLIPALICKTDNVLVFLWGILTVLLTEHLLMSEGLLISNRDVKYFWISILFTSFSNAMCLIIIYSEVASLYLICLLVQSVVLTVFLLDDEMGYSLIQSGVLALATDDVTFYLVS